MPKYKIDVKYSFLGHYLITADSAKDAVRMAKEDCGCTINAGLHSNLNDEDVDWEFPVHPVDTFYGRGILVK